ncbi:MAG: HAD-IB family hydrolase [Bifidobacteriaceae bacterium]|jgi:HAD superfamily hydrolase (TIGR01490 family)|nr:HAD-IB family hydrolase [Bifidobacteriaceae bacterium]
MTEPTAPDAPAALPAARVGASLAPGAPGAKVAAFFDVDNTILRGASIFYVGVGMYRWGFLKVKDIVRMARLNLRYMVFGESRAGLAATRTRSLDAIKDRPVAQMTAVAEQVWDQVLAGRVYPGTKELLDRHLAQGHEVWLISASPTAVVDLVAARVGATGGLGTVVEVRNGYFTGRLVGGLLHGPAKAEAALRLAEQRGIDLAASYAYGDSANDIPILSLVGHPTGINPDRRLRRHCRREHWPVREFRDKRRAVRRSMRAAYQVGAVWAAWVVAQRIARALRRR